MAMASALQMSTATAGHSISRSPAAVNGKLKIQRKYRPRSTQLFAGPGYFPSTSYTEDYKDPHTEPHYKPKGPIDVRNNPHPTEEFMVYHLSKKETPQNVSHSSIRKFEGLIEIVKQQTATTYQDDYLNYRVCPENAQMRRLPSPNAEDDLPLIDSTMHHDYKVPVQNHNLKGNTTRYGCNVGIVKAAHGAVPTLDKQTLPPMSKYKTLYASDFGRSVRGDQRQSKNVNKQNKNVSIHLPALVNSKADTRNPKAAKRSGK